MDNRSRTYFYTGSVHSKKAFAVELGIVLSKITRYLITKMHTWNSSNELHRHAQIQSD